MTVIHRLLVREILKTLGSVTLILLLIIVGQRFVRYLAKAAVGGLSPDALVSLLGLATAKYLVIMLPPALFLSIILVLGRMYKDNEMVVLATCGMSKGYLLRIIVSISVPCALMVGLLALYVTPWASWKITNVKWEQAQSLDLAGLFVGRFNEFRGGDIVFFVEGVNKDNQQLKNIFIQHRQHGQLGILSSQTGHQWTNPDSGERFLVLENGYRYAGIPGQANFQITRFTQFRARISTSHHSQIRLRRGAMPTRSLLQSDDLADQAELEWRLSLPISTLLMALLALPMSTSTPRQGRYGKLLLAVLIYVIYSNLLGVAQAWMEQGYIPATLGLWWVHSLFFGLFLLAFFGDHLRIQAVTRYFQRRLAARAPLP